MAPLTHRSDSDPWEHMRKISGARLGKGEEARGHGRHPRLCVFTAAEARMPLFLSHYFADIAGSVRAKYPWIWQKHLGITGSWQRRSTEGALLWGLTSQMLLNSACCGRNKTHHKHMLGNSSYESFSICASAENTGTIWKINNHMVSQTHNGMNEGLMGLTSHQSWTSTPNSNIKSPLVGERVEGWMEKGERRERKVRKPVTQWTCSSSLGKELMWGRWE